MKTLLLVTCAIALGESPVWACQSDNSTDRLVCPGDKIVTSDNKIGTVAGVNTYSNTVSITVPYYGNYSESLQDVNLAFGCSNNFCIDDVAVTADGKKGTIIGINPYKGHVVISVPYYGNYNSSMTEAYVGVGCVNGICTKDGALTPDGREGTISGVNIYSGKVSIEVPYYGTYEYDSTQMFVKNACLDYDSITRRNRITNWDHRYNFGLQRGIISPVAPLAPIAPVEPVEPIAPIAPPVVPIINVPGGGPVMDSWRGGWNRDRRNRYSGPVYRTPITTVGITCESNDYDMGEDFFGRRAQTNICYVNGRIASANVSVQMSDTACIQGSTWGYTPGSNQIWVQRGCRAQFLVEVSNF